MKKNQKIKAGMLKGRKRISFPVMLLSALVISSLLTLVFYVSFKNYLRYSTQIQLSKCVDLTNERIHSFFEKAKSELPEDKDKITYLNSEITMAADELNKITFEGLKLPGDVNKQCITPRSKGYDVAVTVRPFYGTAPSNIFDDTCLASNKSMFTVEIEFERDSADNGIYVCPVYMKGVPQTEQIYKDYLGLIDSERANWNQIAVMMEFESIYCNKKTGVFIPREGKIILNCSDYPKRSKTIEKEFSLELQEAGSFELVQLSENQYYPYIRMHGIYGTDPETIEYIENVEKSEGLKSGVSYYDSSESLEFGGELLERDGKFWAGSRFIIPFEGRKYDVVIRAVIDPNAPLFIMLRRRAFVLFFIVSFFVVFIFCWRKYILNKAECYFEDYRRDMTGHLAHDIKTPLMAISGYAENIMETAPDDEKKKKYLDSIMGNVEFTKKLIERTAVLNSIENDGGKLSKEKINIEETLRKLFDKYSIMFNERQIDVSLKGSAAVKANRESIESLLENLVSNAVKYTSENGILKAEISPKKLVMTNTVSEKISTKNLKRPFVRGDRSRSNTRGTGLGLSIAESAAQLNGFKLNLKCSEKKFTSEIVFK